MTSDCLLGCLRTWVPAVCNFLLTRLHIFFPWKSSTLNSENTLVLSQWNSVQIKPCSKSHFPLVLQRFGWWALTMSPSRGTGRQQDSLQLGKGRVSVYLLFCTGKEWSNDSRSKACVRIEWWCWGGCNWAVWMKQTPFVAQRGKRPFF